ncbi:MAG: peptidase domain-containing ABC transporter [Saprospiraceae bacterium]
MSKKFPIFKQLDQSDCGPTSLRMVAKYYGRSYPIEYLREKCYITRNGVSVMGISEAAQAIGMRTMAVQIPFSKLLEAPLPCIVYWRQRHFIVVYKIKKGLVYVADPAYGKVEFSQKEFMGGWHGEPQNEDKAGVVLLLEPTPTFFENAPVSEQNNLGLSFLFNYLRPYKKYIVQLFLGMLLGSMLQLIFPFLTQAIVDRGIDYRDLNFIHVILLAQLMLFFSLTAVQFIRSWIMLHMSTRINISLVSDFLAKLMRLPISFFDTRVIGDILQRINDHNRIKSFLTSSTLSVVFSLLNFIVFGIVLAFFNGQIFLIYLISTFLYLIWVTIFLKRRKDIDFKRFDQLSDNQSSLIQLINGMQDIKLNNCEEEKRWEWERIQAKLFQTSVDGLKLSQYQQTGAFFISQFKDIIITYIAAKAVIDGQMTLGAMLAVQYIIGQLSGPLSQLIGFVQVTQDAKISLERLSDIQSKADEDPPEVKKISTLPADKNLQLSQLSFGYEGPNSPLVLNNINLTILSGKVTAIVGASGSGKTTILKLLLKFYAPTSGKITVGGHHLQNVHSGWWRSKIGTVMQDGFIHSGTIAKNIAIGAEQIDYDRLSYAIHIANLYDLIEKLPMGAETKIGAEGVGISQGQKQRILMARAVYKDPEYLLFDEATSALDANNEKVIMDNLNQFFKGKTVVVVAHRLSTVKNADQIVVLDSGKVVEVGTHKELAQKRGYYYGLVKNQLELGA